MALIQIISPLDQPQGLNRLLDEFKINLSSDNFDVFYIIVAFAKSGPLLRLYDEILKWNETKRINAIFGIDAKVTSSEAIQFAIDNFHQIKVLFAENRYNSTFHPKIYLFKGDKSAIAFVGSNNLTVGGTETNFESYVRIEMSLPEDQDILDNLIGIWNSCSDKAIDVDDDLLQSLIQKGLVYSEKEMRKASQYAKIVKRQDGVNDENVNEAFEFPIIDIAPPSPLPKKSLSAGKKKLIEESQEQIHEDIPVSGLVIQVIPHHNGEVFLSKIAVNQNASFFGWPFTGQTVPKKTTNPSYPQRVPDPVIIINVYNENGNLVITHSNFNLNTVYYSKKSEIRITVPQDVVQFTSPFLDYPYPIMLLNNITNIDEIDYLMDIYVPGSDEYTELESLCNQTMPSGGKAIARKFGWL